MDTYFRKHQVVILWGSCVLGVFLFLLGYIYALFVIAYFWAGVAAEQLYGWNKAYRALTHELKQAEDVGDTVRATKAVRLLNLLGPP